MLLKSPQRSRDVPLIAQASYKYKLQYIHLQTGNGPTSKQAISVSCERVESRRPKQRFYSVSVLMYWDFNNNKIILKY